MWYWHPLHLHRLTQCFKLSETSRWDLSWQHEKIAFLKNARKINSSANRILFTGKGKVFPPIIYHLKKTINQTQLLVWSANQIFSEATITRLILYTKESLNENGLKQQVNGNSTNKFGDHLIQIIPSRWDFVVHCCEDRGFSIQSLWRVCNLEKTFAVSLLSMCLWAGELRWHCSSLLPQQRSLQEWSWGAF